MSSSINFSFSSHNVSRSSRRVVFDLGGDGDFAGKADEDIFELLENFKSMDRLETSAPRANDPLYETNLCSSSAHKRRYELVDTYTRYKAFLFRPQIRLHCTAKTKPNRKIILV